MFFFCDGRRSKEKVAPMQFGPFLFSMVTHEKKNKKDSAIFSQALWSLSPSKLPLHHQAQRFWKFIGSSVWQWSFCRRRKKKKKEKEPKGNYVARPNLAGRVVQTRARAMDQRARRFFELGGCWWCFLVRLLVVLYLVMAFDSSPQLRGWGIPLRRNNSNARRESRRRVLFI